MRSENLELFEKHKDILSFRDLAPSTISTYAAYTTAYILWAEESLPDRPLSSVTWEEIRSYVRYLKEIKKLNPRTINVHISQLRDFFFYVLHRDWNKREVPLLHFDEHLPIVPTRDQVSAIINSIVHPKHKAEIALLYSSGIRISELCRLRCKDILHSRSCIYVARSKNRSDRYAVLSDKAYELLVAYIRTAYRNAKPDDWLFPGQKAGSPIVTESVRRIFSDAIQRAGMSDSGFSPHSLRHALAFTCMSPVWI